MSFGGKGGGSGYSGPQLPTGFRTSTPAYTLSSGFGNDNVFKTNLRRAGSAAQDAYDQRFTRSLQDLDTLRGSVKPGFSQLREARLRQISNARSRAVGNLRDTFARRRLSGSSFAADTVTRAELESGEAAAGQEAQSFLEELDTNLRLLEFEGAQVGAALQRELEEFNIASGANVQLSQIVSDNIRFNQQLAAQEAQAKGSFLGQLLGIGGQLVGGIAGSLIAGPIGGSIGSSVGGNLGSLAAGPSGYGVNNSYGPPKLGFSLAGLA